jgi:hypothetical protein
MPIPNAESAYVPSEKLNLTTVWIVEDADTRPRLETGFPEEKP